MVEKGKNEGGGFCQADSPIEKGRWYHLAASFDGQKHRLYVDGKLQADVINGGMPILGQRVFLGASAKEEPQYRFNGSLDELRIYEQSLSAEEIKELAQALPPQAAAPTTKEELDALLKAANPDYTGKAEVKMEGGRIVELNLSRANVTDIRPLAGLPLRTLSLAWNPVKDLSPLRGMPLEELDLWNAKEVADLTPLADAPLRELFAHDTKVADVRPVAGCPLQYLWVYNTPVTDLTPLAQMTKLKSVAITPKNIVKGMDLLRGMKPAEGIAVTYRERYSDGEVKNKVGSLADFWRKYDAGEFGKPPGR
jgi:hypothetical protein